MVALFFSIRSILDVFNNQQTDLLIFGLVILGLAFFTRVPVLGSAVMAIAAGLKANPLFMILLPVLETLDGGGPFYFRHGRMRSGA